MTKRDVDISAIIPHPQTGRRCLCEGPIVVGVLRREQNNVSIIYQGLVSCKGEFLAVVHRTVTMVYS